MKRSWRTGCRIHSTRRGKYRVNYPDTRREEKLPASASTDVIAPYQYGRVYQQRQILPEKRLMLAILNDAVAEFRRYAATCDHKGKKRFREVEGWILVKDSKSVFSFENMCAVLGFDCDYLRLGLRRCTQVRPVNGPSRSAA
jgi:hypothetical protein